MPRSAKVKDYMAASLVTFTPEMEIMDAIDTLVQHRISGAPVVDGHGNLVGVLSEQDCMKVALHSGYYGDPGGRVAEYMSTDIRTVDADTSIVELARTFLTAPYRRYPVLEDERLVGQLGRGEVHRQHGGASLQQVGSTHEALGEFGTQRRHPRRGEQRRGGIRDVLDGIDPGLCVRRVRQWFVHAGLDVRDLGHAGGAHDRDAHPGRFRPRGRLPALSRLPDTEAADP